MLFCILLAVSMPPSRAEEPQPAPPDPAAETKRIEGLIIAARQTLQTVAAKGGDPATNPELRRQVSELWQYGRQHSEQRAGAKATVASIQLLESSRLDREALEKVEQVAPQEPAWEWLPDILLDQAAKTGSYEPMIRKCRTLLAIVEDPVQHGRIQLALGLALERAGRPGEAEEAFQKVIQERPGSRQAETAAGHLQEIRTLNVGQAAPDFTTAAITGEKVALGLLRGKVVLLEFWASF